MAKKLSTDLLNLNLLLHNAAVIILVKHAVIITPHMIIIKNYQIYHHDSFELLFLLY